MKTDLFPRSLCDQCDQAFDPCDPVAYASYVGQLISNHEAIAATFDGPARFELVSFNLYLLFRSLSCNEWFIKRVPRFGAKALEKALEFVDDERLAVTTRGQMRDFLALTALPN